MDRASDGPQGNPGLTQPAGAPPVGAGPIAHRGEPAAELLISGLLRSGVVVSISLVTLGSLLTFFNHPDYFVSLEQLQRLTAPHDAPHSLADVLQGVLALRGQSIVMSGLLITMATPVLRVALSLELFRQQRDWTYVAITGAVLLLLLASVVVGFTAG